MGVRLEILRLTAMGNHKPIKKANSRLEEWEYKATWSWLKNLGIFRKKEQRVPLVSIYEIALKASNLFLGKIVLM